MRVEPDLPDHPKFLRLKRRVGDIALETLVRLWGHCQLSQRGGRWRGADEEYVEIVARWPGEKGALFTALNDLGWIDKTLDAIIIHDWDTFNSRAKASWKNGNKGGRPKKNHDDQGGLTYEQPNDNPSETHQKPTRNQNPQGGSQLVSELVCTEREREWARRVEASAKEFGMVKGRVKVLEAIARENRTADERLELAKLKKRLAELTKKQAAGEF